MAEYNPKEQDEVLETFTEMLRLVTQDGGRKREKGDKVPWTVDPGHEKGLFSHLYKWKAGELMDPDSGAHPLVHAAWRCLALAWQEEEEEREYERAYRENPILRNSLLEQWETNPEQLLRDFSEQEVGTSTEPFKHSPTCDSCYPEA